MYKILYLAIFPSANIHEYAKLAKNSTSTYLEKGIRGENEIIGLGSFFFTQSILRQ